jgi:hypothetical protein
VANKGDRVSEEEQSEVRDTLRLIRDLADALVTQTERYKLLSVHAGADETMLRRIESLVAQAGELKQQITDLTNVSDAADAGGRVVRMPSERRAARPDTRSAAEGISDAAHTLAIEMKIEGHSRDAVELTLQDTFGLTDASDIVNNVFSGSGS